MNLIGIASTEAFGAPAVFTDPPLGYGPFVGAMAPTLTGIPQGIHVPVDLWLDDAWILIFKLFAPDAETPLDMSAPGTLANWVLTDFDGNIVASLSIGAGIGFSGNPKGGILDVIVPRTLTTGIYWDRLTVTIAGNHQTMSVGKIRVHATFALLDMLDVAGVGPVDLLAAIEN